MRRATWISGAVLAAALALPSLSYAGNFNTALTLQETVGVIPNECSPSKLITVEPGTSVYNCYVVTNNDPVTFTMHSLVDSVLGPITLPNGGNFDLGPGASMMAFGSGKVFNTTVFSSTWTASFTTTMTTDVTAGALSDPMASATSGAEVTIGAKPAPALGAGALAFVAAALLVFGALRLSRTLRDPS